MLRFFLLLPRRFLRRVVYPFVNRINLHAEGVRWAGFPRVNGVLHVRNEGSILLGRGVIINSGIANNPIGGDAQTWLWSGPSGRITIGDNSAISNSTIVSFNSVEIGEDVFIGGGCKVYDTDFHPLDLQKRRVGSSAAGEALKRPVRISRGAFIGAHCLILKGVSVGEEAVVGAGSVVTRDIPGREIWAGNPAKCIRKRATE